MSRIRTILLCALLVRVLLPIIAITLHGDRNVFHAPDTLSYLAPATSLTEEGAFQVNSNPEIRRTPGYPLLLTVGLFTGSMEATIIAFQILLGLISVYGVYALTRRLPLIKEPWSSRAASIAALLYAADPLSMFFTVQLLTETLFTTLFVGHLYGMVRYFETRSLKFLGMAAIFLAAAIFVRPIAYYWPFFVVIILLGCSQKNSVRLMTRVVSVGLFLSILITPIALWQVRNFVQTGYRGFSAITDQNLYFYIGASVLAENNGARFLDVRENLADQLQHEVTLRNLTQSQRYKYMGREGIRIVLSQPLTYLPIHLQGILRSILDPGANGYLRFFKLDSAPNGLLANTLDQGVASLLLNVIRTQPLILIANLLFGIFLSAQLLLAGTGLRVPIKRIEIFLLLLSSVLYFLIVAGGPAAYSRFRHPVMPVISIFAGLGTTYISSRYGRHVSNTAKQ